MDILTNIDIQGGKKLSSGKVREIFDVDAGRLLIVTTDRISAFDVILPDPIPDKGHVLNQLSLFWFEKTSAIIPNHVIAAHSEDYPAPFLHDKRLAGRSMLVKKAKPLPVECVVRGYLSGSGWKEYKQKGSICSIPLPQGLSESDKLPEPIFTPTTKAELGHHDEALDFHTTCSLIGEEIAEKVRAISIRIYSLASEHARNHGIIIADTKFEFGRIGGDLLLIDEALTPDSSRFWSLDAYTPGKPQPSFDKQFLRDYLETLDWNKSSPGPKLPAHIISKTREKYIEAYERLTGKQFITA